MLNSEQDAITRKLRAEMEKPPANSPFLGGQPPDPMEIRESGNRRLRAVLAGQQKPKNM